MQRGWSMVQFQKELPNLQYLIIPMGTCVGGTKVDHRRSYSSQRSEIATFKEHQLLRMIYADLGSRTSNNQLTLENFLLFFHKNGCWGDRLFREFSASSGRQISQEEFVRGIERIFKTTENQKIQLLFKFFSGGANQKEGVGFNQFLTMLYNYPKEDLKNILNDQQFVNKELRKFLVADNSCFKGRRLDSECFRDLASSSISETTFRVSQQFSGSDPVQSRIAFQILEHISKKSQAKSTVIKIKVGKNCLEVVTTNINNLVKKFAVSIFRSYNINIRTGKLQLSQFKDWMSNHKQLYNNYYEGFHSEIWEVNKSTLRPCFSEKRFEFSSLAYVYFNDCQKKVVISLLHSILIVCLENNLENPLSIVCLDGLASRKINEQGRGFGIELVHRDQIYSPKKFYTSSEREADQWMEYLKFYKGNSITMHYEMGDKIGIGKFSVVYNCKQTKTGEKYAIKVIESFKLQQQAKKLIAHESSMMELVSHPILVLYKQTLQTKTHIYIVTELVQGEDMFEYVKNLKALSEETAAYIIRQIIIGVRYLHSLGIVHRDLKPENIMIEYGSTKTEVNKIKIIDFGFANYLDRLKEMPRHEALAGTPNYIAPEALKMDEDLTFKIDNFAIGSILYFALSGKLPFNGCNMHEILQKTLQGSYQINDKRWRSISPEAKDLVSKLLENDPQQRISIDEALKHPWFKNFPSIPESPTLSRMQSYTENLL